MNSLDDKGLNLQQRVFQIPPVAILFLFPGILLLVYVLLFALSSVFSNISDRVDFYNLNWIYAGIGSLMTGAIAAMIASRYKRDAVLTSGTCSKTCGPGGTITGRAISKAPLFGGYIPLKSKWDGAPCFIIPCGGTVQVFTLPSSFSIPTNFNQKGLSASLVYFVPNAPGATLTSPKDKVKFSDSCTFEGVNTAGNTYVIKTTTGYPNPGTSGNAIMTTPISTTITGSNDPDTKGDINQKFGSNNLTVSVLTDKDGNVKKTCEVLVNIDILYYDTLFSLKINSNELIPNPSTQLTQNNNTPATATSFGFFQLTNISLSSPDNIIVMDITMQNTKSQGYLMYSVYDVTNNEIIYMQSNANSTKALKSA